MYDKSGSKIGIIHKSWTENTHVTRVCSTLIAPIITFSHGRSSYLSHSYDVFDPFFTFVHLDEGSEISIRHENLIVKS